MSRQTAAASPLLLDTAAVGIQGAIQVLEVLNQRHFPNTLINSMVQDLPLEVYNYSASQAFPHFHAT